MIAHVGGFPVEETLGAFGPVLFLSASVAMATVRARLGRNRPRR